MEGKLGTEGWKGNLEGKVGREGWKGNLEWKMEGMVGWLESKFYYIIIKPHPRSTNLDGSQEPVMVLSNGV